MMRGSMPYSWAMPSATGISRATTAEWLSAPVLRIPSAEMTRMTWRGVAAQRSTVMLASHVDAPDLLSAAPSAMAPPYMSSTPQLTYVSTSDHVSSENRKRTTTPASAIEAR